MRPRDCLSQVRLTEEDTEYAIYVVKHVFDGHVVFQFNCTNTIPEQVLEGVSVALDLADAVSACFLLCLLVRLLCRGRCPASTPWGLRAWGGAGGDLADAVRAADLQHIRRQGPRTQHEQQRPDRPGH